MNFLRHLFLQMAFAVGILVAWLPGQTRNTPDTVRAADTLPGTQSADLTAGSIAANKGPTQTDSEQIDVMTLGARGVVVLNELEGNGVLFGISDSQGYGWVRRKTLPDSSGALSVVQPYVGLFRAGRRSKTVFQYSPTIDLYDGRGFDGSAFHRAAVNGLDKITERWTWNFSSLAMHGPESVREIAALAIDDGSGAIDGLTYTLPNDTLTLAEGSAGLSWSRTPRQQLSFTIGDSYASVTHGGNSDTGWARAQISSNVGRNSQWSSYAQLHSYSNHPGHVLFGLGGGYKSKLGEKTTVALEGGPEIAAGGRGGRVSVAFAGSLQQQLWSRTAAYLRAERDLIVPYLSQSRWADNFSARLKQVTSRSTFVEASGAYVHGSDVIDGTERLRGTLWGAELHWRTTENVTLVGAYRYFKRETPIPSFPDRHTWALCTFVWQPTSRAFKR